MVIGGLKLLHYLENADISSGNIDLCHSVCVEPLQYGESVALVNHLGTRNNTIEPSPLLILIFLVPRLPVKLAHQSQWFAFSRHLSYLGCYF